MLKAKQLLVFNASRHLYNNIICEMNWFAKYLAIILSENLFYVFAGHEIPVFSLFLLFFNFTLAQIFKIFCDITGKFHFETALTLSRQQRNCLKVTGCGWFCAHLWLIVLTFNGLR